MLQLTGPKPVFYKDPLHKFSNAVTHPLFLVSLAVSKILSRTHFLFPWLFDSPFSRLKDSRLLTFFILKTTFIICFETILAVIFFYLLTRATLGHCRGESLT